MSSPPRKDKTYPVFQDGRPAKAPNYRRLAEGLTDDELRHEWEMGLGPPGFQAAVYVEAKHRGITLA